MNKELLLGVGVGSVLTLLTSYVTKTYTHAQNSKEIEKRVFVGIELGGTNYSVAFG